MTAFGIGNGRSYNAMLQVRQTAQGNLNTVYGYSPTQNNGKIVSATDNILGETVNYTYDSLNRLASAAASNGAWGNSYVYDGYGNLLQKNVTAGSAPSLSQAVNLGNNQIVGNSYDANGNQTSLYVPGTGNVQLTYDIENRMTAFIGNTGRYAYNAQNQRVWRKTVNGSGQATEVFSFYGIDGKVLETYTPTYSVYSGGTYMALTQSEEELYFAGRLIGRTNWEYSNTFQPISADPLGTVRWDAAVAPNGVTEAFWPWGEERGTMTGNDRVKYGTYWRDSESSLDYGVNRYYSSVTGRFLEADPYQANGGGAGDPSDPQSWNRYAYTRGDPVNRYDPWGFFDCVASWCSQGTSATPPDSGGPSVGAVIIAPFGGGDSTALSGTGQILKGGGRGGAFGSISIQKSFNIDVPCRKTASGVIGDLRSNFASFGNYTGSFDWLPTTLSFQVPAGGILPGDVIGIPHTLAGVTLFDSVTVAEVSATSFVFATNPGHPLNATIGFTAQNIGSGFLGFTVDINGQTANGFWSIFFAAGGGSFEDGVWNHLLDQVTADCAKP